jgi:radical SAM superfamily enzyme YgiQ (UPF0313 family)
MLVPSEIDPAERRRIMIEAFERGGIRGPGDPELTDLAHEVAPGEPDPRRAEVHRQSDPSRPGIAPPPQMVVVNGMRMDRNMATRLGLLPDPKLPPTPPESTQSHPDSVPEDDVQ